MSEPIIVNDVAYDSPSDAARALGLSTSAIYKAKREGRLNSVGETGKHGKAVPVSLFKCTWETMAQCCSELGCAETTLRKVLNGTASERQVENMRERVEAHLGKPVSAPVAAPVALSTPVFPTAAAMPQTAGAV